MGKDWRNSFAFLAALDVASHWMHTSSAALTQSHHKAAEVLEKRGFLLRLYYTNRNFMGLCCVGAELFYVTLLMLSYDPRMVFELYGVQIPIIFLETFTWRMCFPCCVMKNIINVNQLAAAAYAICEADVANATE